MVGTVTYDTINPDPSMKEWREMIILIYCKGDEIDGSIPDKVIEALNGWKLHTVSAWPKKDAIAPSIADIAILTAEDEGSENLLGDPTNGRQNGIGLLTPDRRQTTVPILTYKAPSSPVESTLYPISYKPIIKENLILHIENQIVPSAEWYIELCLSR